MMKGEPLMMTLTGSLDHNNIIEVAPDDHNNNEWLSHNGDDCTRQNYNKNNRNSIYY